MNGDGFVDLIVMVETSSFAISESDQFAEFEGKTFSGVTIRGSDTVRVVP